MSEVKIPTKFEDFKVAELRTIADDEFAVEVGEKASKAEILAALLENGVTFDLYLDQHPELKAVIVEDAHVAAVEETSANNVITSTQMKQKVEEENVEVVVKEETPLSSRQEWLIRMDRANPLYEIRGHRFTQENPFALMTPEDAEYVLTKEDGFRQATPNELATFFN